MLACGFVPCGDIYIYFHIRRAEYVSMRGCVDVCAPGLRSLCVCVCEGEYRLRSLGPCIIRYQWPSAQCQTSEISPAPVWMFISTALSKWIVLVSYPL